MRAVVLVLGDLGRSPRMLAHAGALLDAGYAVHLVGGTATSLPARLHLSENVHLHPVDPGRAGGRHGALATALRGVRLTWDLARALLHDAPPFDVLLVQTPPSVPTLPVALLAARLRRARLLVDWHNLGWPLLGLRFGDAHPLVRALRRVEIACGRAGRFHLAVTRALAERLGAFGIMGVRVLHDRPAAVRPFGPARTDLPADPLVVVAPMGWSRDDDLPLLAEALLHLHERMSQHAGRHIRVRVSGTGPLREEWGARLARCATDSIAVDVIDVPSAQYGELLAGAHVGLSLHRSASGLDAPLKVVELLASGVPVLALDDGGPLDEIAPRDGGVRRYANARELAEQLASLLDAARLAELRMQVRPHELPNWESEWRNIAAPLLPETAGRV